MKLEDIPAFCGDLSLWKELYPYKLNTRENIIDRNGFVRIDEIEDEEIWKHVEEVGESLGLVFDEEQGKEINLIGYSAYYCKRDVEILKNGMEKLNEVCEKLLNLSSFDFLSISSIAEKYLKNCGVYDGVFKLGGVCREFIQKCVVGGWVMCKNNEIMSFKTEENDFMSDFDAVSLYPSAMRRLVK